MTRPEEFMEDVRKIFPATYAAKDGWTMELKFDEGSERSYEENQHIRD